MAGEPCGLVAGHVLPAVVGGFGGDRPAVADALKCAQETDEVDHTGLPRQHALADVQLLDRHVAGRIVDVYHCDIVCGELFQVVYGFAGAVAVEAVDHQADVGLARVGDQFAYGG